MNDHGAGAYDPRFSPPPVLHVALGFATLVLLAIGGCSVTVSDGKRSMSVSPNR